MQVIKRGDTIIEVVFAFAVFATVSVAAIAIMNSGLNQAQRSLESTMARNEINAQVEAIKFIHNSYSSERSYSGSQYKNLWKMLTSSPVDANKVKSVFKDVNTYSSCEAVYKDQIHDDTRVLDNQVFAINPRYLLPEDSVGGTAYTAKKEKMVVYKKKMASDGTGKILRTPTLYPRIRYQKKTGDSDDGTLKTDMDYFATANSIEGIWVFVAAGTKNGNVKYYDFYVRTCWQSSSKAPSTISTIIRVYNPELAE